MLHLCYFIMVTSEVEEGVKPDCPMAAKACTVPASMAPDTQPLSCPALCGRDEKLRADGYEVS